MMLTRKKILMACVCLAASALAPGQTSSNPGTALVFQLPGANSGGTHLQGVPYAAASLSPTIDNANAPAGTFQIVPKPDGSKYFVLSEQSGNISLSYTDATFSTFTAVSGLGSAPTLMTLTPDGTQAYVATTSGTIYVLDTTTDQIVGSAIAPNGTVVGIVFSLDGSTAYVARSLAFGSTLTAYKTTNQTQTGSAVTIGGGASGLAISPVGLLYVAATNQIYEVDPSTMQTTSGAPIQFVASPGPMRFTPDGNTIYFVNRAPATGLKSLVAVDIPTHTVQTWPPLGSASVPLLDDVYIISSTRILTFSSQNSTLYDVTPSPLSATVSSLQNVTTSLGTVEVAVSNEIPATELYMVTNQGNYDNLVRVNLSSNTANAQQQAVLTGGSLQFVPIPPQSGVASFIKFNDGQTIAAKATSLPLIARLLDAQNRPVYNVTASFTVDSSTGVKINNPSPVSTSDGYVATTVTAPSTAGTYTITLTANGANTSYTVNVPGSNGGGGTGGFQQVTIISGDGQLVPEYDLTGLGNVDLPMVLQVTDTKGNPLSGVAVTYTITNSASGAPGTGLLAGPNLAGPNLVYTDTNGLASIDFQASVPDNGAAFETDLITAVTKYGSVTFTETEVLQNADNTSAPIISLDQPTLETSRTITVTEGVPLPNGAVAEIYSSTYPQAGLPIPGVGIFIVNRDFTTANAPASCQGSSLSDKNGVAHCTVITSCTVKPGLYPISISVGGLYYAAFQALLQINQGGASKVAATSGNNQSGKGGQNLASPLIAIVTDGCGSPVAGAQVTWKVTQGSATLINSITTSSSGGTVSTGLTFGQTPGVVTVTVSLGTTATATFNLTNQVVVNNLAVVSGNNQTAYVNAQFTQPLVVKVTDVNNTPVPGVQVAFSIVSGGASLSAGSATTDGSGQASVTVTAGPTTGTVSISASYSSLNANFTLTIQQQGPAITAANFTNAASLQQGLATCGLATLIGPGIAPGLTQIQSGIPTGLPGGLALTVAGVSITVNGVKAPIQAVAPLSNGNQQVNFQTPCETQAGSTTVVVTASNGATTTVTNVPVYAAQPGVFTYQANGKTYAVITDTNGAYVTAQNPAVRGKSYILYATGMGQTNPTLATNSIGCPPVSTTCQTPASAYTVTVSVNGQGVPLVAAQYLDGAVGAYVVEFTLPSDGPSGTDLPLTVTVVPSGQSAPSQSGVLIVAVQ